MAKKEAKNSFEDSLKRLEEIVTALEQGDAPLDEAIKIYEEGIHLSVQCLETLNSAETKIKKLTKDLNGKFQLSDFEE